MDILYEVTRYYEQHAECVNQEGLEEYKGPQTYEDRANKEALHYYGKGWYKWYRISEFKKQMSSIFGED